MRPFPAPRDTLDSQTVAGCRERHLVNGHPPPQPRRTQALTNLSKCRSATPGWTAVSLRWRWSGNARGHGMLTRSVGVTAARRSRGTAGGQCNSGCGRLVAFSCVNPHTPTKKGRAGCAPALPITVPDSRSSLAIYVRHPCKDFGPWARSPESPGRCQRPESMSSPQFPSTSCRSTRISSRGSTGL